MTDKRTKAELLAALHEAQSRPPEVSVRNCSIGDMGHIHMDAIIALAEAVKANAEAITAIARKASVFIETGISINTGNAA